MRGLVGVWLWLCCAAASAAVGSWSPIGPFGGAATKVQFHPGNAAIAYATGNGGVYRSSDGGVTWAPAEVGLPPGMFNPRLLVAPSNGNIVYVLAYEPRNALYRSDDAALTFHRLPPIVSPSTPDASDMAISPNNPDQLAVSFPAGLRISNDGGASFVDSGAYPATPFESFKVARFGNQILLGGINPASPLNFLETFEAAGGTDNPGWYQQILQGTIQWQLSTVVAQSPIYSAHAPSEAIASNRVLVSPPVVALSGTTLSFRHTFAFEVGMAMQCYDGGTLEISTDDGVTWSVLPDAAFSAGGFNGTVETAFGNPIAGKRAWCGGTVGPLTTVTANLGAYAGQAVRLRWNSGDDSSVAGTGWFIDNVTIANAQTFSSLLFRSIDGGNTFVPTTVVADNAVVELKFATSDPTVAYYGLEGVSGRTVDGGATWQSLPFPADFFNGVHISPTSPTSIVYASPTQAYSSNDGGLTSTALGPAVSPYISSISPVPNYPGMPTLLAGTLGRGIIRSVNNGTNWSDSYQGFRAYSTRALAIPGNNPQRVFAGQGDVRFLAHALQVSNNGGSTWTQNSLNQIANSIRGLVIDPTSAGQIIYATGRLSGSGGPQNGGIYKSVDGGTSWQAISNGIPVFGPGRSMGLVRSIVLDPRSCLSPPPSGPCTSGPLRTVYVAGSGRTDFTNGGWIAGMVYKSTDAGANWTVADTGLPVPGPLGENLLQGISLAIDPVNTSTLYVGLAADYFNLAVPSGVTAGIYKSTNGGASWTAINAGLPIVPGSAGLPPDVLAIAVDPGSPQTLYAGVSVVEEPGSPVAGIYKSTNGGVNWTNASNGVVGADVRALLVDPSTPSTVYAGSIGTYTSPAGVYKSTNSGGVWRSISIGLFTNSVFSLAHDPSDANTLYAGTNTGVWKLTQVPDTDGDGASTATENGAPNGGDGNGDAIPDATQSDVASAVNAPIVRGRINYVTMGGGTALATEGSGCTQLTDVYSIDPRIFPPDLRPGGGDFDHDEFGLVNVEVPNCSSVVLTIKFHEGAFLSPNWTWRNYGPTTPGDDATVGWYGFPSAVKLNATTWRLTINANQLGSWRPSPTSILFRGGPAFFPEQILSNGFE